MKINIFTILFLFFYNNAIAQCENPDLSIWNNTWQSCQTSQNPNPLRGEGHWIQYDFGAIYTISKAHVWNTNEVEKTQNGFRNVVVDYSLDGVTWTELGSYEFSQGTEEAIYGGFEGFDFNGEQARYVIISATSNWGGSCYGLAEVKFNLLLDIENFDVPCIDPPCGKGECEPVEDVTILEVGEDYAWIAWEAIGDAEGYIIAYTPVGQDDWEEIVVDDPEVYLLELDDETEYEFVIIVICEEEEESEETEPFYFTTLEEGTTSINNLDKTGVSKINLVPNPTDSKVHLIFDSKINGEGVVEIRNVNGLQVKNQPLNFSTGKNNHLISVEDLTGGVYFVTIINQDQGIKITKRLVVIN